MSMAPHSSTPAWKIPWMEEPGWLQSMGSRRVGHEWATSLSLSCNGEGSDNQLQCSCLENPRDGGACWAAVYGVTQSRTILKRLSSSSSRLVISFLPRRKCLLISWLHTISSDFGAQKIKLATVSTVSHLFPMKWWDQLPSSSFSKCWALSQHFHSPLSLSSRGFLVLHHFCHKGGVICVS